MIELMIASYLLNILLMVVTFIKITKGVKTLEKDRKGLSPKGMVDLNHKRFLNKFAYFLIINLLFMGVGIFTCLNSNPTNTSEDLIGIGVKTGFVIFYILLFIFVVYNRKTIKKYNINLVYSTDNILNVGTGGKVLGVTCAIASIAFAVHTGFVVYRIAALIL